MSASFQPIMGAWLLITFTLSLSLPALPGEVLVHLVVVLHPSVTVHEKLQHG